ncbi:MAG TPA: hypothetical protein VNK04_03990 [Gemmataceae bacterium]|nr:hypothetical protein [Gemmataceae bacterium]
MSERTATNLLADLRSRGIELETDGRRLRWRPAFLVSAPLAARIQAEAAALIQLLQAPSQLPQCPQCSWPLDSKRRCVKCFDRLCESCSRLTGSYFVALCLRCHRWGDTEGRRTPE